MIIRTSTISVLRKRLTNVGKRFRRGFLTDNAFFKISPEVRDAVMGGRPVVALETTIYTHGFPHPENIALSDHLEQTVRSHGAVPATIGILNGVITVGLSTEESHQLFETSRQPTTIKISRRDIGYICGLGMNGRVLNGGTTIAGTMILAHLAGIKVFATGGLGGVHRGGENSMDISADLTELGRTPVAVISSGCKSFLDIPRTLEYLETQGTGVTTFSDGRGDAVEFPAFWTRDSGIKSPKTIHDEHEAAAIIYAQSKLGIQSGLLFASPIPKEYSVPQSVMDQIIADAIKEAEKHGASGSDNTPFILDYIHRLTEGGSISANRKLVENNVIRGSKVAVALANLERGDEYTSSFASYATNTEQSIDVEHHLDVIVAGSLAMDLCCDYNPIIAAENVPILETSNPASISQSLGGVGHNIATALHYVGTRVRLCAPIGDDLAGRTAFRNLKSRGLDTTGLRTIHGSGATPQYVAVNDKLKNMFVAMADMRLLEGSADMVDQFWPSELVNSRPKWLVVDANWSTELVGRWIQAGRAVGSKIALEPVSVEKSSRMFCKTWKDHMQRYLKSRTESTEYLADLVSPNRAELKAMAQQIRPENAWSALLTNLASPLDDLLSVHVANFEDVASDATKLLSDFGCIVTKLGSEGVLLAELLFEGDSRLEDVNQDRYIVFRKADLSSHKNGANLLPPIDPDSSISTIAGIYIRHYPPAKKVAAQDVINVNGVGDTFLGVLIAASLKKSDAHISELINIAQQSAILTLQDSAAVSPKIKTLLI